MGFLTKANENRPSAPMLISDQALTDLLIQDYMEELFDLAHAQELNWQVFLTTDPEDLSYRKDILTEFKQFPDIVMKVRAVCTCILEIQTICRAPRSFGYNSDSLQEFKLFRHAYDTLSDLAAALKEQIEKEKISSAGLKRLYEVVQEKLDKHYFTSFAQDWDAVTSGLDMIGSYTLRFTLDPEMHLKGCAITAIHKQKYARKILPFGSKEGRHPDKLWDLSPVKEMRSPVEELLHDAMRIHYRQFLSTMRDMTEDLDDLYRDLNFYLAALNYWHQMEGYHLEPIFAEIRPMEEKAFSATNMIDPVLLLFRHDAVGNDITFAPNGELLILTGMNQGGKTTFLRTVGTLQLLFQLGWPVPADTATISPVEKIVTVFSHEENTQLKHGKLGQELKTLRLGMTEMTPCSLMLFNEPITGTSPMENLYLSREILSVCKLSGYHGIWVTHIYDLAAGCDEINQDLSGSQVSSLVVKVEGTGENVRTSYHIVRGQPGFTSYAKQVLEREVGKIG